MKEQTKKVQYFLGANSADGFVSFYDQLINEEEARAFYILKGGPGCGKSTLMKKVGAHMEQLGFCVEYVLCSADPQSLDGIVIPEKKIAIVDGTAPHEMGTKTQTKSSSEYECSVRVVLFFRRIFVL